MKKIIHIITGLGSGGAEHMLYKLLKYSDENKYYHEVISLTDKGIYGGKIEELGITVHSLNLNKKNVISSIIKTRKISKKFEIIDTWLYHADIFGFLIGRVLLRKKLIWNIRHSNLDKDANTSKILKIVKMNSKISKHVNLITYNSNEALNNHVNFGYDDNRSIIIPNGFELDKFKFDLDNRINLREDLGFKKKDKVIITVGRWNIQKDYYTLLKSLDRLREQNNNFTMVMVGTDLDNSNKELLSLINKYELNDKILLLGRQNNIPALLSAADIYVSSSLGESFSNAIGEAMACELPCVVTDVGESKLMVGETGKVVDSGDYIGLSNELLNYINNPKLDRNEEARNRVIENFNIKTISKDFEKNYENIE